MDCRIFAAVSIVLLTLAACTAAPPQIAVPVVPDEDVSDYPISKPPLTYPPAWLAGNVGARVDVTCTVPVTGQPKDCVAKGDNRDQNGVFDVPAIEQVTHSRYKPATHDGIPVEARHTWTIYFNSKPEPMTGPPPVLALGKPAAGERYVSERPIAAPPLVYPPAMQHAGREGQVDVECDVTIEGFTEACAVSSSMGGTEFAQAALNYVSHARYLPALHGGVPVQTRHRWTISFRLTGGIDPAPLVAAALAAPLPQQRAISEHPIAGPSLIAPADLRVLGKEGTVLVSCLVTVQDRTKDCRIEKSAGEPGFDGAALDYVTHSFYESEVRNGVAVEARHSWSIAFRKTDPLPVVRAVTVQHP